MDLEKKGRIWYVKAGNLRKDVNASMEKRLDREAWEHGENGPGAQGSLHGPPPGLRGGAERGPSRVVGALRGPSLASY